MAAVEILRSLGLPQDDNSDDVPQDDTGRAAQKKIHGAAASAAERCDFCEKDSLLPVCRSWREHRPVYGPSLGICVVREIARQGGATEKQHV